MDIFPEEATGRDYDLGDTYIIEETETIVSSSEKEFRRRLGRLFHETGQRNRKLLERQAAYTSLKNDSTVEPGAAFAKGHRKRKSLTNPLKPTPLESKPEKPVEQEDPIESMGTYFNYSLQIKPFSGRSKDYQSIVDFLETIESQATAEHRSDVAAREKLQLRLFRTNLRGDARSMLNMLTPAERDDWGQIKTLYIAKFKTERDQRARQKAREAIASFKQRSDESLRAYRERAVKLRQLIDATDEVFLVSRFLCGVKDEAIRQMFAVGQEDISKLTVSQLNQRIINLVGAGEESGSDRDSEDSADESGDDSSDDESHRRRRKRSSRAKSDGRALKTAQKVISEMEEKLRLLKADKVESFAVQAPRPYQPQGNYQPQNNFQGYQSRRENGQETAASGSYTCYNCGQLGHMARFCPDRANGRPSRMGGTPTVLFPSENGPQRMIWVDYPPNGLKPGYYPVEPSSQRAIPVHKNLINEPAKESSAGRITELKDVAYVDIVSSAADNMKIGRDVVRYVNAVEDVFVAERRRRNDTDAGSSDAPPRQRGRLTGRQPVANVRLGELVDDDAVGPQP